MCPFILQPELAQDSVLIIVEGVDCYSGDCDWWGGNLEGVSRYPITLNVSNRLVYSAHDYAQISTGRAGLIAARVSPAYPRFGTKFWGYISANHIAPVLIGEFGTDNNASDIQSAAPASQGQWFESLVDFLQNNSSLTWTYWTLNGEDSYPLLNNQYDSTPVSSTERARVDSVGSHWRRQRQRNLFRCSFSAFRFVGCGGLFQPNQSELDCGHSAGQLQHYVQSVPQHHQRIHPILKQSNCEWSDHSFLHE